MGNRPDTKKRILKSFWVTTIGIAFVIGPMVFMSSCATDSQTGKQAGWGAAYGAVGGAVAGAVGSLLWGSNPIEGTIKGGIAGAASGAAVGAVSGVMKDGEVKKSQTQTSDDVPPKEAAKNIAADPKFIELKKKIGDENYEAVVLFAGCKHREAIGAANEAYVATPDKDRRIYALMVQAMAAEESGNKRLASTIYPRMVQEDPARQSIEKARADTLEGVIMVQKIRQAHGLPPLCHGTGKDEGK
jgi:hypothetical protein